MTVMLFFGKKIPSEKGNVRLCIVVMQQPVILLPTFGSKSSQIFTQSQSNVIVVCLIDWLACQDEFSVNNPHDVEIYEHSLDFALHLSHLFWSQCTKSNAHALFLCWILCKITSGQIHDSK
jgi:hypothetical protein